MTASLTLTAFRCGRAVMFYTVLSLSRGHANFMKRLRPYSRDATLSFFQVEFSRWPCNAEERQPVGSQNKRTRLNLDWRGKRSADVGVGTVALVRAYEGRRTLLSKGTARIVTIMTPRGALLIANSACCKLLSPMLCCAARIVFFLRALRGCCCHETRFLFRWLRLL